MKGGGVTAERGRGYSSFYGPALEITEKNRYRSRTWIWNFPGVFRPLVVMAVFVGKRSIEDVPDIGHRVHAHGRALEHGALNKQTSVEHPEKVDRFAPVAWEQR